MPSPQARRSLYTALIGAVVGALAVGVVMPFVIESTDESGSAPSGLVATGDSTAPSDETTAADATSAGDSSGPVGGSTSAGRSGSSAATRPAGPAGANAAAAGPTAPIKVGFTILDTATVGRAGINVLISPEQQERAWRAYVQDVNDRNLIGRKIEPVFSTYDVFSQDSQTASCLALTEDHKVFAVLGGYNFASPNACVVEQHATPMVSNMGSNPDSYYTKSAGRLITATARSSRMFTNAVGVLDSVGALNGKRIGILRSDANDPSGEATGHLQNALESAGHRVVHVSRLPAPPASDTATPIEVNRMSQSQAEVVFLLAGSTSSTGFVQAADAQGFRPRYVTTDWGAMFNDTSNMNMPNSYDGALGITNARAPEYRVDRPEPALAKECKATYERVSKTQLAARGSNEYALTVIYCDLVRMFVAGMRAGGAATTKEQFPAAMGRVGALAFGSWGDGEYRPGKPDAGDWVLLQQWRVGCKCFHPVGDFRRGRV